MTLGRRVIRMHSARHIPQLFFGILNWDLIALDYLVKSISHIDKLSDCNLSPLGIAGERQAQDSGGIGSLVVSPQGFKPLAKEFLGFIPTRDRFGVLVDQPDELHAATGKDGNGRHRNFNEEILPAEQFIGCLRRKPDFVAVQVSVQSGEAFDIPIPPDFVKHEVHPDIDIVLPLKRLEKIVSQLTVVPKELSEAERLVLLREAPSSTHSSMEDCQEILYALDVISAGVACAGGTPDRFGERRGQSCGVAGERGLAVGFDCLHGVHLLKMQKNTGSPPKIEGKPVDKSLIPLKIEVMRWFRRRSRSYHRDRSED